MVRQVPSLPAKRQRSISRLLHSVTPRRISPKLPVLIDELVAGLALEFARGGHTIRDSRDWSPVGSSKLLRCIKELGIPLDQGSISAYKAAWEKALQKPSAKTVPKDE